MFSLQESSSASKRKIVLRRTAKKSAHGNGSADVRGVDAVNGFLRFLDAEHADAGDDTTHLTGGVIPTAFFGSPVSA